MWHWCNFFTATRVRVVRCSKLRELISFPRTSKIMCILLGKFFTVAFAASLPLNFRSKLQSKLMARNRQLATQYQPPTRQRTNDIIPVSSATAQPIYSPSRSFDSFSACGGLNFLLFIIITIFYFGVRVAGRPQWFSFSLLLWAKIKKSFLHSLRTQTRAIFYGWHSRSRSNCCIINHTI